MPSTLTAETIADLLKPYVAGMPPPAPGWPQIHAQLATYLELILKWNARTNLTAVRTPEEIVRRHFGESLFAGAHLEAELGANLGAKLGAKLGAESDAESGESPTLLDYGSGAGFPGLPIQLLRPDLAVTLAESQGKKAAFLREAVRNLGLATEVWAGRVESMPPARRFHTVALRAVDDMDLAVAEAAGRAASRVLVLTTAHQPAYSGLTDHFRIAGPIRVPESADGVLLIARRI